jgi:hypothetical protein
MITVARRYACAGMASGQSRMNSVHQLAHDKRWAAQHAVEPVKTKKPDPRSSLNNLFGENNPYAKSEGPRAIARCVCFYFL